MKKLFLIFIFTSISPMNLSLVNYTTLTVDDTWQRFEITGVATTSTTNFLFINSAGGGDASVYAVDNVTVRKQ